MVRLPKPTTGASEASHTISHHDHAGLCFYSVEIEGTSVGKVEAVLNIADEVVRFLIVKPDLRLWLRLRLPLRKGHDDISDKNDKKTEEEQYLEKPGRVIEMARSFNQVTLMGT